MATELVRLCGVPHRHVMKRAEKNKERRRLRREQVAQERADRQREIVEKRRAAGPRLLLTAKARRGDALEIRFDFTNAVVVPVNPGADDPTEDVRSKVDLALMALKIAKESQSD